MKTKLLVLLLIVTVIACNTDPRSKIATTGNFGITFDTTQAIAVSAVPELLHIQNNLSIKVIGTVDAYCKGEGCWLTLQNPNGESILVEVKDKAFVLPTEINGKTAIVNGIASEDSIQAISIIADGIVLR